MKKYNVGLASLLLFFATGAAIAMETNKYEVYTIQNKLNDPIKVTIAYKNGESTEFSLPINGTANLNLQNQIKKIGCRKADLDSKMTKWHDAVKLFKQINKDYDTYFPQKDMRVDIQVFQSKLEPQWTDKKTNKVVEAKDPWSNYVPN